ncbi:hypothetical protein [Streptomyces sp. LN325]|uniref:hypothetical protein n=1 Tax=Streptomyces sp. LN325 TaxID=3112976 RepID=UPI0037136F8A
MTKTDQTPLAKPVSPREIPDAAIAMLDVEGTVVGWTHAAEQLVGYPAGKWWAGPPHTCCRPPRTPRVLQRSPGSVVPRMAGPAP